MKSLNNIIIRSALILATLIFFGINAEAQKLDKAKAKSIVESKRFVFKAQTVSPLGAASRQLTSEYDVRVLGDSLVSYLPYFGRAFIAPNPGEPGGINFTSTNFEYKAKPKKKGGWEIAIKPNDTKDVRQLLLSITESGYASLNVTSNNRQFFFNDA